jgi:acetolactate synthase I/II/III large subunit
VNQRYPGHPAGSAVATEARLTVGNPASRKCVESSDRLTGAQTAIGQISAEGVDVVFGIPGVHNIRLCDAVLDHPELRFISGRHEQDIAFMANGFCRATGRIAVPLVISGPGVTNSLTALADAYSDSVPMVLLAACPARGLSGKGAFHELRDQTGLLGSVTKWNVRVDQVEDVADAVRAAFSQAYGGRPGPTAVEIPVDVQAEECATDVWASSPVSRQTADPLLVREAARCLAQARRPVIYLGSGAASSDCAAEAIQLTETLQAVCLATALGQGVVPTEHPLFVGFRWAEDGPARPLLEDADAMLVVGSSLDEVETGGWTIPIPKTLIQIDVCPEMIGRNYPVTIGLIADAQAALRQILAELGTAQSGQRSSPIAQIQQIKDRAIARVRGRLEWQYVDAVSQALPRDAYVSNDASIANMWFLAYLERHLPRTMNITRSMGALGYAFPSAIGAKVARPERQAVAIAGDGGFLFTANALATAVQYRLNAVAIVFNDNCYSSIKLSQNRMQGRTIGVELHNPDFVRLAEAHGAIGVLADTPSRLYDALSAAWTRDLPTVIEVPMGMSSGWFEK